MIEPSDLVPVPEHLAVRLIATANSIAPCLQSLDGTSKSNAIAILKAVAAEAIPRGSRFVKGQKTGNSSVEYFEVDSWFSDDDRAGLRAFCVAAVGDMGPVGSFPTPSKVVHRLWPEE